MAIATEVDVIEVPRNKDVHPSLVRMYELAKEEGIVGPVALAKALGETKQTVSNWRGPGVSTKGAMKAQALRKWSAAWIMTGQGSRRINPTLSELINSPVPIPNEMVRVSSVVGALVMKDSLVVLEDRPANHKYVLVISTGQSENLKTYEVGFSTERVRKGEFAVVDPKREPVNLDDCLIHYYDARREADVWAFERFTGHLRDGEYFSFEGKTLDTPHIVASKDVRTLYVLVSINPPHSVIPPPPPPPPASSAND